MRQIRYAPDPVLRQPARPVHRFGPVLRRLVDDLFALSDAHHGAGLAAPQIGVTSEVFVITYAGTRLALCNPYPVAYSGGETQPEGCLSIPGVRVAVPRATNIVVSYRTPDGTEATLYADGLLARIVQHEMDHLDGILITDYAKDDYLLTSQTVAACGRRPLQSGDRRHAGVVH